MHPENMMLGGRGVERARHERLVSDVVYAKYAGRANPGGHRRVLAQAGGRERGRRLHGHEDPAVTVRTPHAWAVAADAERQIY